MKTKIAAILFLIVLLPSISAAEISMNSNLSQGATLIAKVSGNFIQPITSSNVILLRDWHINIPVEFSVKKISNDFYIYAQLYGKIPGNYSLEIKNAQYLNVNQIVKSNLTKNFTITNETVDFFVNPGFVVSDADFNLSLQNLMSNEITVSYGLSNSSSSSGGFFESLFGTQKTSRNSTTLGSNELKKISFPIDFFNIGLNALEVTSENTNYEIPVYASYENQTTEENKSLSFEPGKLNVTLAANSNATRILTLSNNGNAILDNISLSSSGFASQYIAVSPENITDLTDNSTQKIQVVFSSGNHTGTFEGQIKADANGVYAYVGVVVNIVSSYIPPEGENTSPLTCSELTGNFCSDSTQCNGEIKYASDGVCCIGTCETPSTSSAGKIIGWTAIVAVILLFAWFYFGRYRKTKRTVNLFRAAVGKKG